MSVSSLAAFCSYSCTRRADPEGVHDLWMDRGPPPNFHCGFYAGAIQFQIVGKSRGIKDPLCGS